MITINELNYDGGKSSPSTRLYRTKQQILDRFRHRFLRPITFTNDIFELQRILEHILLTN